MNDPKEAAISFAARTLSESVTARLRALEALQQQEVDALMERAGLAAAEIARELMLPYSSAHKLVQLC